MNTILFMAVALLVLMPISGCMKEERFSAGTSSATPSPTASAPSQRESLRQAAHAAASTAAASAAGDKKKVDLRSMATWNKNTKNGPVVVRKIGRAHV